MIRFNKLKLSEDKSRILVDCFVSNISIYSKMFIKEIFVEYYKNATVSGAVSDKAIKIFDNTTNEPSLRAVYATLDMNHLEVKEKFGLTSFDSGLFYVIVRCDGELSPDLATLPCGFDKTEYTGVVLDWKRLYEEGIQHAAAMSNACGDTCDTRAFDAFMMIWNSLKLAITVCDYKLIARLWEKFLRSYGYGGQRLVTSCGCNRT